MTFARTVFTATAAWVAAITLLQAHLNWNAFDPGSPARNARRFRVGFLPVT